jgi:hypothetical protein
VQKRLFTSLVLLFVVMTVACTAAFNWREVRVDEQGFTALFPAKATFEQQTIRFQEVDLTMTMAAAMAEDSLFAVGSMPFDKKILNGSSIMAWMQSNTAKLIQSQIPPQSITFEIKTASTPATFIPAQGFNLKGLGPDGHYRIYWVRWMVRTNEAGESKIYQLSALKPFKSTPNEEEQKVIIDQFETFMMGFKPD